MKGEDGCVRGRFPCGRDIWLELDIAVAVADQRVENRLLESPRYGVVSGGWIERRNVVGICQAQDHRIGRQVERRRSATASEGEGDCESIEGQNGAAIFP